MYLAIELKTKEDGSMEVGTYKKDTRELGEQAFHSIMSVAAVSSYPIHTGLLIDEYGAKLKCETYKHQPAENGIPAEGKGKGEE